MAAYGRRKLVAQPFLWTRKRMLKVEKEFKAIIMKIDEFCAMLALDDKLQKR